MADTIPLRYAQSLLRLAQRPKEELRRELLDLNLPLVLLQDRAVAGARLPVGDYGRLFIHLVHQLQSQLPSHSGNTRSALMFSAYRMLYEAMLHAGNLKRATQRASIYFQRLQPQGETFHLEENGELVHCRFEFTTPEEQSLITPEKFSLEQLNWLPGLTGRLLSLATWHRVCGWFIGSFIELESVQLKQAARGDKDYSEVFGIPVQFNSPVQFGSPQDAFTFHRRYLEFPIVQSEDSVDRLLKTYPAELLKFGPEDHSVSNKVKQLIGSDFQRPLPGLQEIAERLHMTTPTLHRRLREEGTSFQQLKDQCRKKAAIEYLSRGDYTTQQLSELMGFSDSSTFHRAFKKWTGMRPQEYRRQHC